MTNSDQNLEEMHESFDEILAEANCDVTGSELQGIFAGLVSVGLKTFCCQAKVAVLDVVNDAQTFDKPTQESVDKLFIETLRAFREEDALPIIMIPNDDYPLIDRLEAISLWCQGFLLGFGLQLGDKKQLKPEINEALIDISEISQIEIEADNSEEAEKSLQLLLEHIKVAVKVIYLELVFKQEQAADKSSDKSCTYH